MTTPSLRDMASPTPAVVLSAVGAGGPLDVYLQQSPDDGVTWVDWLHFLQVASGATLVVVAPQFVNTAAAFPPLGTNLTPALAAATGVGSHPGDRLRVVYRTGAGWGLAVAQTIKLHGVERMNNR